MRLAITCLPTACRVQDQSVMENVWIGASGYKIYRWYLQQHVAIAAFMTWLAKIQSEWFSYWVSDSSVSPDICSPSPHPPAFSSSSVHCSSMSSTAIFIVCKLWLLGEPILCFHIRQCGNAAGLQLPHWMHILSFTHSLCIRYTFFLFFFFWQNCECISLLYTQFEILSSFSELLKHWRLFCEPHSRYYPVCWIIHSIAKTWNPSSTQNPVHQNGWVNSKHNLQWLPCNA